MATASLSTVDLAHGGRWTSLRSGGREWLWSRPDPARQTVRPGDAFVDAGGLEECLPTVRGKPDHGSAWSRPWLRRGESAVVATGDFELARTIRHEDGDELTFSLHAEGQPVSMALWRNLGGFPWREPYRSIGVEPMLGRVFDLAEAGPGDAATVPASGVCQWRLVVR